MSQDKISEPSICPVCKKGELVAVDGNVLEKWACQNDECGRVFIALPKMTNARC